MLRSRSQGFTLIELMIVVAIITILSVLAVGAYRRLINRARVTEVHAVFADIRAKEESYRAEFTTYLSASNSDSDFWPVLGSGGGEPAPKNWTPPPAGWTNLGLKPYRDQLYCGYAVMAAPANAWGSVASVSAQIFIATPPGVGWWVATAMCDNDGIAGTIDSGTNATFITSSKSTVVGEYNQGR